jgi:octaprenyl-diphosphate synthase
MIRRSIEQGSLEELDGILAAIRETGALAHTYTQARNSARQASAALGRLPASQYKDALVALADFAVERRY